MKYAQKSRRDFLSIMALLAWNSAACAQLLEMTAAEQQLLGVEVQAVTTVTAASTGELTLRVGFSPDGEWAIKTPLPGILHRVWVQVGDRVRAGDPLMTIRSPEVVSLQRDFLKARADLDLQEAAWARDRKLSDAGSVSSRRWQETVYSYESAKAEFAGLQAQLILAGFSEQDLDRLGQEPVISPDLTMRAPVDSIVLERPAMLGDHLDGAELLARLGEPDRLILEGTVPGSLAANLGEGMSISMQGAENRAVIVMVSGVIDPQSQTVNVRADPVGTAGLLPGQLTRWSVQSGASLLVVPTSAVVKLDGLDVAFVQVDGGFEPRVVNVRSTGSGTWVVFDGLQPGEEVVVRGTAVLKGMSVGMGGGDS